MAANQLRSPSIMMGWWANNVQNVATLALSVSSTWLALGFVVDQGKTLANVRLFLNAITGTPAASELTCDLYSDNNGVPGTSVESHAASSVPAGNNWMDWTGFTTALTAGTQYWLVFKNGNATPGANFPTYQWVGSASFLSETGMPLGAGSNFNGSAVMYGWNKCSTANSGTSWGTVASSVSGVRVGFSDSTYDGMPVQTTVRPTNSATGDRAFGKQESGVKFNVPAGVTFNVRGVWMPLAKVGTPGNLRFRIYQGTTLLGTTNAVPAGNVTTANGEGYTAYFSSALSLVSTSQPYRVVMSDATSTDANTSAYEPQLYTWDSNANSLTLKPMNGTLQKTITADNTASPPVFTDTNTDLFPFALLLDTLGELTSAGGGTVPAASDVRNGVAVGAGTGTLVVPAAGNVLTGTTFDNGTAGTATRPAANQVLTGNTYGASGTELTGTVVLPIVGDVESGVGFGAASALTGTFVVPAASNVANGVGYGAGGTEFTGTNTGGGSTGGLLMGADYNGGYE